MICGLSDASLDFPSSACLLITTVRPAKAVEPIEMPFGADWLWVRPKNRRSGQLAPPDEYDGQVRAGTAMRRFATTRCSNLLSVCSGELCGVGKSDAAAESSERNQVAACTGDGSETKNGTRRPVPRPRPTGARDQCLTPQPDRDLQNQDKCLYDNARPVPRPRPRIRRDRRPIYKTP